MTIERDWLTEFLYLLLTIYLSENVEGRNTLLSLGIYLQKRLIDENKVNGLNAPWLIFY